MWETVVLPHRNIVARNEGSCTHRHLVHVHLGAWRKSSTKELKRELHVNHKAAVEWNLAMREVVADTLMRNRVTVGGPCLTVQVDETVYSMKKYNRGPSYPQQWVFGGLCLQTGDCFMMPVTDRSSATLISAIRQNIELGSTIMSDE
uniref:ISXO2-like transposase domain-containing protein n=1 Tax=Trichuris muris TaxID=70415 RepID=A0A5S6Q8P5_TRIMR